MVDAAAAANLEWLGLNLCRMNRGGQNHVTYYEPEKNKGGSEQREEQKGENIMDKGSNEAERERWREKGEEDMGKVMWRGEEGRRTGGRGESVVGEKGGEVEAEGGKQGNVPHCQLFLTLRLCLYCKQRQREGDGREE